MCTKIINDQLTDLFYNFIEMEDRIAANDRYADLNSSDMRFLSAVGKGVLGDDCLIDCSQIPMIYCNYDTQDVVDITLDDLQVGDEIILAIRSSEIENLQKEDDNKAKIAVEQLQLGTQRIKQFPVFETEKSEVMEGIEMKINFRLQIIVTLILVIAGFISSLWFNKDIYYNLA